MKPRSSAESVGENGEEPLLRRLVGFCQALREADLVVTPTETMDASRALSFTNLSDKDEFYNGLKATLVKHLEDYPVFDPLFEHYWLGKRVQPKVNPLGRIRWPSEPRSAKNRVNTPRANTGQTAQGRTSNNTLQQIISSREILPKEISDQVYGIYSPIETTNKKRFSDVNAREKAALKRGLRTFAKRVATLPGRRFAVSDEGRMNFRRTLRSSLKSGGIVTEIHLGNPKITKSRLVILADISGSMDLYSDGLVKLLYHLSNTIHRTEVFAFSTRLIPLNKFILGKSLSEATRLVSDNVDIWSSGTRIGSVLGQLISEYPGSLRPSTVLVIISDGWELGDLDLLKRRLEAIKKRVAMLVWLNPQADSPNYSPEAAGMKTALPLLDVFSGVNMFTDRREFLRVFGRTIYAPTRAPNKH